MGLREKKDLTTIEGEIMDCLLCLPKLEKLSFYGCENLASLPERFGECKSLTTLNLNGCKNLFELPDSIGDLTSLTELNLGGCYMPEALQAQLENQGCDVIL